MSTFQTAKTGFLSKLYHYVYYLETTNLIAVPQKTLWGPTTLTIHKNL